MCYIGASDDAAYWLEDENRYKFCNGLSILELVAIGGALTDYNFQTHVASDIALDDKFLQPQNLNTQRNPLYCIPEYRDFTTAEIGFFA